MKKLLLLIVTAAGAGIVTRKVREQQADQRLWAEATEGTTGTGGS
ncbi:MAG TPA: DLW-39 family protein [Dermatophilaceae bacterium]|nr:DLW-39 family protein [Dermatophilaceae bacterium]